MARFPALALTCCFLLIPFAVSRLLAEEESPGPGDVVIVTASQTDLVLQGKVVAELKRGTSFEIAKTTTDSLAGYAIVDGKKLAGWVRRKDVSLPETAAAGSKPPTVGSSVPQAKDDEPNVPLKYMSLARIRALPAEPNFDSSFLGPQPRIDPKREIVSLDIIRPTAKEVENSLLRPDGKVVVTSSADGDVNIVEYNSERPLMEFHPHNGRVRLAFSPDGAILATGGVKEGEIKLWQLSTQELLVTWEQAPDIRSIEFSSDGKWLLCGSYDPEKRQGELVVYDVAQRKRKTTIDGENMGGIDVAFSADNKRIAAVRVPKVRKNNEEPMCWTEVWEWESQKRILALPNVYAMAMCVDFSPIADELAIGETEGESMMNTPNRVRIVDATSGETKAKLVGFRHVMGDVKYAPNGKTLACMCFDRTLRIWDTETYKMVGLASFEFGYEMGQVSFAADGRTLTVSNTAASEVLGETRLAYINDNAYTSMFYGNALNRIQAAAFTPDGRYVSFARQGAVYRFDLKNNTEEEIIPASNSSKTPYIRQLSDDGSLAARSEKSIEIFSIPDAKRVSEFTVHNLRLYSDKFFSHDGRYYAAGYQDGVIEVWDVKSGKLLGTAQYPGFPNRLIFSIDNKLLFAADFNAQQTVVGVWDLSDRKEPTGRPLEHVRNFPAGNLMHQLYALPDGERIMVVGEPSAMINIKTFEVTPVPLSIWTVAFTSDGKYLATAGEKVEYEVVRILDAETLKEVKSFKGPHPAAVRCLRFSPDGKMLATGCEAGIFALWDTQTGKEIVFDAKTKYIEDFLKPKGKP